MSFVRWACWMSALTALLVTAAAGQVRVGYSGTGGAETIRLRLHNTANRVATHRVFAGEAHPCVIPHHQPLVTAQDLTFTLAAGERRTELVPVYCGNSHVPCPSNGMLYLAPSKPYPHLRTIILNPANQDNPLAIQELIWQSTDQYRLPESGPPTVLEMVIPNSRPSGPDRAPGLMCRAGLPGSEPLQPLSRTERQHASARAMGWIGAFLMIPVPLAIICALTWLLVPTRRRSGPRHA